MVEVRKAGAPDVAQLGRTLARAFNDDPAFAWAVPDAERRSRFGPRYFEVLVRRIYLPKGLVFTVGDGTAAALWAPPGNWQTSTSASLPLLPVMFRACRGSLPLALKMVTMMETRHKAQTEQHYYLPFIGTDPAHRGVGLGSALLVEMLRRCDEEGVAAYLESTGIRNQSLYYRHGFRVLDEMHWPNGGPEWWPMWREPRSR